MLQCAPMKRLLPVFLFFSAPAYAQSGEELFRERAVRAGRSGTGESA